MLGVTMAVNTDVEMDDVAAEVHDGDQPKKLSGRRKKAAKAKQVKPGSFGATFRCRLRPARCVCK